MTLSDTVKTVEFAEADWAWPSEEFKKTMESLCNLSGGAMTVGRGNCSSVRVDDEPGVQRRLYGAAETNIRSDENLFNPLTIYFQKRLTDDGRVVLEEVSCNAFDKKSNTNIKGEKEVIDVAVALAVKTGMISQAALRQVVASSAAPAPQ